MLGGIGWRDALASVSLEFVTGTNDSQLLPIALSLCQLTRLTLSDGTAECLVETLGDAGPPRPVMSFQYRARNVDVIKNRRESWHLG